MNYGPLSNIVGLQQIVGVDAGGNPVNAAGQVVYTAPASPRLVPQAMDESRELLLGIGDVSTGGVTFSVVGQSAVFTTQPQLPFRPSRFVIPDDLAALFDVDDFKIGKNSQFLSSSPVPGAVFSQLAVGVALGLDTCSVGQQITVAVTLASTAGALAPAYRFLSAVIGTSIQ